MVRASLKLTDVDGRDHALFPGLAKLALCLPERYYRMCSLTIECVLFPGLAKLALCLPERYYRMCSLTIECVLFPGLAKLALCLPERYTLSREHILW